ncbi:MAG: gliding motility-associated C-terminal domain-containing protein [Bacteroidales bacterium]
MNFYQQPVANAGTGGNNCGLEFYLGATPGIGTGTWSLVNGPGTATFSPNANTGNAKVTVSAYGTHTFRWTEVNGVCSNSSTISITFYQQPSANAGNGGNECEKDFILNAVPGPVPGIWTKIGGPGNAVFSPGANQANTKVTVSQFGSYDFAWTEANTLCTSTDIVRVTFHDLPSISTGADIAVCKGGSIQLNAFGSGSFQWTPANQVNNQAISNPVATPVATSVFTVTLTDQWGCKNSDQVSIEVREQPVANAGPDQVLEYLFETTLNAATLGDGQTGEWTIISGTGEFANKNDNATYISKLSLEKNSFKWTLTNGVCPSSSDTVNIIVNNLIIPTLITPNNDGKNDYFMIKGIETLGKTELVIFNRWGPRVYVNDNYDNKWNGVDNNVDPLPDDTYFFVLSPEKSKPVRGYIVIRR